MIAQRVSLLEGSFDFYSNVSFKNTNYHADKNNTIFHWRSSCFDPKLVIPVRKNMSESLKRTILWL